MNRVHAAFGALVPAFISSRVHAGIWWEYGWNANDLAERGYWWEYGWDRVTEALSTGDWLTLLSILLEAF